MPKPPLKSNPIPQKLFRQCLRKRGTVAEAILWRALKDRQIEGIKFRRQFGVGNYVLDFYAPEIKLAIELDGASHFSIPQDEYDKTRTRVLFREHDIHVLRFENREVMQQLQGCVFEITREVKRILNGEGFVGRVRGSFEDIGRGDFSGRWR